MSAVYFQLNRNRTMASLADISGQCFYGLIVRHVVLHCDMFTGHLLAPETRYQ